MRNRRPLLGWILFSLYVLLPAAMLTLAVWAGFRLGNTRLIAVASAAALISYGFAAYLMVRGVREWHR
jgi:hypothetical protein